MDDRIRRLDARLATPPAVRSTLQPGATSDELARFPSELGVPAPPDLLALLRWRNGQPEGAPAFQYDRALLTTRDILAGRAMLRELLELGDIERWNDAWIPFLRNWGVDVLRIDTAGTRRGVPGELFVRTSDDEELSPDHPSLRCWLQVFVETLEAGLWSGAGDFHPSDDDAVDAHIARLAPGYPAHDDDDD